MNVLVIQLPFQAIFLLLILAVALCVYGVIMADPGTNGRTWEKAGRVILGMLIAFSGIGIVMGLILLRQV